MMPHCAAHGANAISQLQSAIQCFQLINHCCNHLQAFLPKARVAGIQPKRGKQLLMSHCTTCPQHGKVFIRKAIGLLLIDSIEGIDQTIAKGVGINIKKGYE